MKRLSLILSMIFVMLFAATAQADLLENGTFDDSLASWNTFGDVVWDNGAAILGSNSALGVSAIGQDFYIQPGTTSLDVSFDLTFSGLDWNLIANDTAKVVMSTLQMDGWWIFEWENWTNEVIYEWNSGSDTYTTINFKGSVLLGEYDDITPNANISFVLDQSLLGGLDFFLFTTMSVDNVFVGQFSSEVGSTPTPEPGTVLLMGAGLAGLALHMRRRNK